MLTVFLAHYFGEIACPTRTKSKKNQIIILNVKLFDLRVVVHRKFVKNVNEKSEFCVENMKMKCEWRMETGDIEIATKIFVCII